MANKNYPAAVIDTVPSEDVQRLVTSLKELHDKGKPENDDELEHRINDFFEFCQTSSIRPGIESLCCALSISRTTLFNWSRGDGCTKRRQELIESAKSVISAFIEQVLMSGKISPPSGIFLMKNWLNYKDTVSLEENTPKDDGRRVLSASELPKLKDFLETEGENERTD